MHVRIKQDYEYRWPDAFGVTTDFKAGREELVKREVGEALVAAGVAEEISAPSRAEVAAKAGETKANTLPATA